MVESDHRHFAFFSLQLWGLRHIGPAFVKNRAPLEAAQGACIGRTTSAAEEMGFIPLSRKSNLPQEW
jgi:hypothetical protein